MNTRQKQYLAHRMAHFEVHGGVRAHSLDRTCQECRSQFRREFQKLMDGQYPDPEDPCHPINRRRQSARESYANRKAREARFNERMPSAPKASLEIRWGSCLS